MKNQHGWTLNDWELFFVLSFINSYKKIHIENFHKLFAFFSQKRERNKKNIWSGSKSRWLENKENDVDIEREKEWEWNLTRDNQDVDSIMQDHAKESLILKCVNQNSLFHFTMNLRIGWVVFSFPLPFKRTNERTADAHTWSSCLILLLDEIIFTRPCASSESIKPSNSKPSVDGSLCLLHRSWNTNNN